MSRALLEEVYKDIIEREDEADEDLSDIALARLILQAHDIPAKGTDSFIIGRACGLSNRQPRLVPRTDDLPVVDLPVETPPVADDIFGLWFYGEQPQPLDVLYAALYTSISKRPIEVKGGNYRRVPLRAGEAWSEPQGGEFHNANPVMFNKASSLWGQIVGVGLLDDENNLKLLGPVQDIIEVQVGDRYTIPEGNLIIRRR